MSVVESLSGAGIEPDFYPGQYLAKERKEQGLSQEYVAGKLHLRVKMVALIEEDSYAELPQPVFVQGYLRAYSKLLGLNPIPILESYSARRAPESTNERILRQKSKEPVFTETHKRIIVIAITALVVCAFYFWWNHHMSHNMTDHHATTAFKETTEKVEQQDLNLTDLSKMDPMNSNLSAQGPAES